MLLSLPSSALSLLPAFTLALSVSRLTKPRFLGSLWLRLSWPHFLLFSFFSVLPHASSPSDRTSQGFCTVSCLQHQVVTTLVPVSVCRPALGVLLLRNCQFPSVSLRQPSPLFSLSGRRLSCKAVCSSGRFNRRLLQAVFPNSHIQVIMSGDYDPSSQHSVKVKCVHLLWRGLS